MLREVLNVRQVPGEQPRRWFFSHEQDLLVWFAEDGTPAAFQLAYGKTDREHALRWKTGGGFAHHKVDDGEAMALGKKGTPLLMPDGPFEAALVLARFRDLARELPADLVAFITERLREHPGYRPED